jgi:hypothetical protein
MEKKKKRKTLSGAAKNVRTEKGQNKKVLETKV